MPEKHLNIKELFGKTLSGPILVVKNRGPLENSFRLHSFRCFLGILTKKPGQQGHEAEVQLLRAARRCARGRVVVKRSRNSADFAGERPQ